MGRTGYTQNTSPDATSTARYLVGGYFHGDGQHFTAIFDLESSSYLQYHPRQICLFRNPTEAIEFLRLHDYI